MGGTHFSPIHPLAPAACGRLPPLGRRLEYQSRLHNLHLSVTLPCLIAAWQVPVAPCAPQSASTLAEIMTLAGLEGRITSPTVRGWFFLFGVGALFVLSRPGCFNERLTTGVLSAACGRSLRFFARVTLALATRGTARAAILAAAFTSLSIAPCSGHEETSCVGWETRAPHL